MANLNLAGSETRGGGRGQLSAVGGDEEIGRPLEGAGDVQGVQSAEGKPFEETDRRLDDLDREIEDGHVLEVGEKGSFGLHILLIAERGLAAETIEGRDDLRGSDQADGCFVRLSKYRLDGIAARLPDVPLSQAGRIQENAHRVTYRVIVPGGSRG